jgi:hypothetical protein
MTVVQLMSENPTYTLVLVYLALQFLLKMTNLVRLTIRPDAPAHNEDADLDV